MYEIYYDECSASTLKIDKYLYVDVQMALSWVYLVNIECLHFGVCILE